MPSSNKIYKLRDPESKEIYQFHINHYPTVSESIELIGKEKIRRNELQLNQHNTNRQEDIATEQRAKQYQKDEAPKRMGEFVGGLGESLINTLNGAISPIKNLVSPPQKTPEQFGRPTLQEIGQDSNLSSNIGPQLRRDIITDETKRMGASGTPIITPLIKSGQATLKEDYREAGRQFGEATQEGVVLGSLTSGFKRTPQINPVSRPTGLNISPVETPQLTRGGNEDFIDAEVVPNKSVQPNQIIKSPSLSPSEGGEAGKLLVKSPSIRTETINRTQPQVIRPPQRTLIMPPIAETLNQTQVQPLNTQVQSPNKIDNRIDKETRMEVDEHMRLSGITNREEALADVLAAHKAKDEVKVNSPLKKNQDIQSVNNQLDVLKQQLSQANNQIAKNIIQKKINALEPPVEVQPLIKKPQNLNKEQQDFINKGGKITVLPPNKPPDDQIFDSNEVKQLAKDYHRKVKPPSIEMEATTTGAKLGSNTPELAKILGSSLYSSRSPNIIAKELLQNASDAVRNSPIKNITPFVDHINKSISINDTGPGMTKEELQTVFTNLGGSGKRGDKFASGGFGIAKAAPLLMGEKIRVITIANENGQLMQHSFEATPDEIINGFNISSKKVSPGTPTGTEVTVYLPKSAFTHNIEDFINDFKSKSLNLPGQIQGDYKKSKSIDFQPISKINTPSAEVTLYTSKEKNPVNKLEGIVNVEVNNNGIFQFTKDIYLGGDTQIRGVPTRIAVDVHSLVPEGHPEYPFTANRESMRAEIYEKVQTEVKDKIIRPLIDDITNEISSTYKNIPKLQNGVSVLDSGDRLTRAEKLIIYSHPAMNDIAINIQDVGTQIIQIIKDHPRMQKELPNVGNKTERVGIVLSSKVHGMSIPSPNGLNRTILINPFSSLKEMSSGWEYAAKLYQTIKHELLHDEILGHHATFTSAENTLESVLGKHSNDLIQKLLDVVSEGKNYDKIRADLSYPLSIYEKSLGREATTPDILRGEEQHIGITRKDKESSNERLQRSGESSISEPKISSKSSEEGGVILGVGLGGLQKLVGNLFGKSNSPGDIESYFGKVDETLKRYPATKVIGEQLERTPMAMNRRDNEYLSEINDIKKGLNREDRLAINDIDRSYDKLNQMRTKYKPELIQRAIELHDFMEYVRGNTEKGIQGARIPIPPSFKVKSIGWRKNYVPDIKALSGDDFIGTIENIINSQGVIRQFLDDIKNITPFLKHTGSQLPDIFHEGSGLPSSPHILTHHGTLQDTEEDPFIAATKYAISMSRLEHLRPMYQAMKNVHNNSKLTPELRKVLQSAMGQLKTPDLDDQYLASSLQRLTSELQQSIMTSKLGFAPKIAAIHASAIMTQAWPKLNSIKYIAKGIGGFFEKPLETWNIVRKYNPTLSSMPFRMRSLPRQIQDIAAFHHLAEHFAESLTYNGFKQKAIDSGLKGQDAEDTAAAEMLKSFGLSQRGSMSPAMASLKSNIIGKFATMYRTTIYNLGENYGRAIQDFLNNPTNFNEWKKLMYYILAGYTAYKLAEKYKLPLWHYSKSMLKFTTGLEGLGPVLIEVANGNWEKAEKNFIRYLKPSVKSGYEKHGIKGTILDYPYTRGSRAGGNKSGFIDISPNIELPKIDLNF